jgi:hypothetical protein
VNAVQFTTTSSDDSLPTSVLVLSIICAALGVGLMAFLLISFLYFIWKGAATLRFQREKQRLAEQQAVMRLHTMNPLARPLPESTNTHSPTGSAPLRRAIRRGSSTSGLLDEETGTDTQLSPEAKSQSPSDSSGRLGVRNVRPATVTPDRGLRGSFVATSAGGLQSVRSANRILSQKRVGTNRSAVTPTSQSRTSATGATPSQQSR